VCPIVSQRGDYTELNHHIFLFLFVTGLTTILLVGGLGVAVKLMASAAKPFSYSM
jgi:hypothetical protein